MKFRKPNYLDRITRSKVSVKRESKGEYPQLLTFLIVLLSARKYIVFVFAKSDIPEQIVTK
jgi:hypothetical protein